MEIKKGDCGHFCEACARRDDRIRELEAELAHVRAKLPDVPKRERECRTLDDWRCLALYYESEWRGCSDAFNKRAGDLKAELAALRQQQGEPVAWRFKNNSGDAVTIWIDYVPQAIESVERQAREAGGWIEYAYNREVAPRAPDWWKPIETAPQDENLHVLLFGNGPNIEECCFVGFWNSRAYGVKGWYGLDGKLHTPTHWMPLPEPPQPPDCKSEIQSGDESDNIKDIFSKT